MSARVQSVPRRASGRKVSAGSELDPEVDPAGFARPAVR